MKAVRSQKAGALPVQALLKGEYLHIARLHKDFNNLSVVPHRHDHYEFILVSKGQGRHSIDFKSYELVPGRLFFLHKGQVHLIENFERDGWLIFFGEELYKRFLQMHPHENEYGLLDSYSPFPYVDLDETLLRQFLLVIEQLQTELTTHQQDQDILLHYVALLLLQANRAQIVQHPRELLSRAHQRTFVQLKQLIEQHFRQQHLAAFYATTLNMDIKKINRICREATGNTLFELLQERLITECKILLQTSADSVKEISYELGFNDPAFFGRFFRKHTGFTPADFRQRRTL